jgi:hypothetical protein
VAESVWLVWRCCHNGSGYNPPQLAALCGTWQAAQREALKARAYIDDFHGPCYPCAWSPPDPSGTDLWRIANDRREYVEIEEREVSRG